MEFTIKLSEAELNLVLSQLAKRPYIQIAPVIQKIQTQAGEQVRSQQQSPVQ